MMKHSIWEWVRMIVVALFVAWVILKLGGCASIPLTHDQCNATRYPTAEEHEQCLRAAAEYEQEQYEREDRRIVRRDKLIAFLNACDKDADLVIYQKIHIRDCLPTDRQKRTAMREYGHKYTHDNVPECARKTAILCVDPAEVLRSIGY